MRTTVLIVFAAGMAGSLGAAEIAPADRFGSLHQSAASRVPLLPGPYLLSPAGTPSLNGHNWKAIHFGQRPLGAKANAGSAKTKPRGDTAPKVRPSAQAPAAETLRFDETLPNLDTSLPATRPRSTGL